MVNSKKMSKSSIAVIVLSILLVLSMILGLTGAWFTDKGSDKTSDSIKFGNIDISAELTRKINAGTWTNALPGDSTPVAGNVTVAANSENMYVLVKTSATIKDSDENLVELYVEKDGDNKTPVLLASFAATELPSTWKEVTISGTSPLVAGEKLYYVAKTDAAKVLNLEGVVSFAQTAKNVVYKNDGTAVRLNVDSPELSYDIEVTLAATAVQARNIITAETPNSITAEQATTIVNAIRAYDNVEAAA